MKRDAATAPVVGERVAFVIIKGAKGAKANEKAEDPIYALENNLPIDAQHYLEHHLELPLMRIFEPILGEKRAKSLFTGALLCVRAFGCAQSLFTGALLCIRASGCAKSLFTGALRVFVCLDVTIDNRPELPD